VSQTLLKTGNQATSKASRQAAKAAVRPDSWARLLELEVDTKKFTTNRRKYIVAPLRERSDEVIIKKAAQMGFTVGMIIKTLHNATERRWNGLYLLPFKAGARTFVQSRVDPILDSNDKLSGRFDNVANVSHKQTDEKANLYFRGTNIKTELVETPVDFQIWDERDRFVEKWLGDARARMDGSDVAKLIQLSTPTGPGIGIDDEDSWRVSDQCKWEVPCPHCNRYQVLDWEANVKLGDTYLDTVLECVFCHKRITDQQRWDANDEGHWTPTFLDGKKRGYHITQLNSPSKSLRKIFKQYYDALDDVQQQRDFVNLVLGEPYAGKGDKFTETTLDDCRVRGHVLRRIPESAIFVGVDVGSVLHVKASTLGRSVNGQYSRLMWDWKILRNFGQLEKYLSELHNFNCVIDADPERSKAKELAEKFKGHVWLGMEKDRQEQTELAVFDDKKFEVRINRTMAFDQYIWDHERGVYILPQNARELGEELPKKNYNGFYAHHLEMVRVPKELPDGRNVIRWEKTRNPDHWHHTGMFELIAMLRKPSLSIPAKLSDVLTRSGGLVEAA
jgi:phage terminase large subunit GpA